jgi:hypothetical protein
MRDLSHWDRSTGDEHIGLVMLIVLAGAIIFGVFFFLRMGGAFLRVPNVDVLGARSEVVSQRPGSGFQPGSQAQPQQQQAPAAVQAQPEAKPHAQPTVQPTATVQTGTARVAHTDGAGVVLRASPKDNDWTPRGFMDGAEVTILERQGTDWVRVRGSNNQEGWIPAKYLDQ